MTTVPARFAHLDNELAAVSGTVSVWWGPLGGAPRYARLADETHYAASTMKVAVLAAVYRAIEGGTSDVDTEIPVRNEFPSAQESAPAYGCRPDYDNDDEVWERLGGTATLGWLARRMIVRSSNLATNLCLRVAGLPAVAEVWRLARARHSVTGRGIEDAAANRAGITNVVTAADLAALLSTIALGARTGGPLGGAATCQAMLDVLLAQERGEDLAAGLPPGTRIAHKNGWVEGIRHGAGVVFPDDAPGYSVICCTSTDLPDADARQLVAKVAAETWAARDLLE